MPRMPMDVAAHHGHPGRCPDCPEFFRCGCCGEAWVTEDGAWCSDCTDAQDAFIEEMRAAEDEVFA